MILLALTRLARARSSFSGCRLGRRKRSAPSGVALARPFFTCHKVCRRVDKSSGHPRQPALRIHRDTSPDTAALSHSEFGGVVRPGHGRLDNELAPGIEFDIPWSEQTDTETVNPVEYWLKVMPNATETAPD